MMVFAPEGRQTIAGWIGATMLVLAGGAVGYKRLYFKAPLTHLSLGERPVKVEGLETPPEDERPVKIEGLEPLPEDEPPPRDEQSPKKD